MGFENKMPRRAFGYEREREREREREGIKRRNKVTEVLQD
jgi:hypothetical protein